jgi:hypothetical protein
MSTIAGAENASSALPIAVACAGAVAPWLKVVTGRRPRGFSMKVTSWLVSTPSRTSASRACERSCSTRQARSSRLVVVPLDPPMRRSGSPTQ